LINGLLTLEDITMKKILLALVTLALVGCASYGHPFEWDNARKLRVGMDATDVVKLVGQPTQIIGKADNSQIWRWIYATSWKGSQSMTLIFKDDKVTQVPKVPDSF
jgi:outer membrane protein assembly factor BamE (lipoprotein component of BamABCDE complex)